MVGDLEAGGKSPGFLSLRALAAWLLSASAPVPALRGVGRTTLAWLLVLALAVALLRPPFAHAVEVWSTTEEFSFGFLVPAVTLLLLWWHRAEIRDAAGAGSNAGLIIIVPALALYLLAYRVGINALAGLAVVPLLWGVSIFLWGWGAGQVLAFPIGFLAFGLALYRGLLDSVGFALQGITAVGAAQIAQLVGVPVVRDGLVLRSDQFAFLVAQACSGMSSLVSLLALAALWIHLARGPALGRLAVMASVLPLVVVANTTRVALVLVIATLFGQDAALGFFHGASSLVLFGIALSGLLLLSWLVGCKAPRPAF